MKNGGLTLGKLIDLLKTQEPQQSVIFDFGGVTPTGIDSYRGFYEDLAIGFSDDEVHMTVGAFTTLLKGAVNKVFTGYKGGEYRMTRRSSLWVANYRHTSGTIISGLMTCDFMTVLSTGWQDV